MFADPPGCSSGGPRSAGPPEVPGRLEASLPPFVDSHCHLTMEAFDADREEVIARAQAAGVGRMLVVSASAGDTRKVLELARSRSDLWAAAGVHPHEARDYGSETEEELRRALADPLVVAVGEIGLDYHYDRSPREVQRQAFRRQIRLARDHGRPLVVHTRQARADTLRILEEEGAPALGGVFHCFTEDGATAEWALANGFFISFSGVLTFRNAGELREVARGIPLERTLVETDSPYLAPVPVRGRRNEPAFVHHVAACLAAIHGNTEQEIGRVTSDNFHRLFRQG